jgi:hypothetical protein
MLAGARAVVGVRPRALNEILLTAPLAFKMNQKSAAMLIGARF